MGRFVRMPEFLFRFIRNRSRFVRMRNETLFNGTERESIRTVTHNTHEKKMTQIFQQQKNTFFYCSFYDIFAKKPRTKECHFAK